MFNKEKIVGGCASRRNILITYRHMGDDGNVRGV